MKKLFAILMAVSMLLTLAVAAFAADPTGTITVNGIGTDSKTVYDVYKILKLNDYDVTTGKYSYSVEAEWAPFFAQDEIKAYIELDEAGYVVKWAGADDDDTVAAFAKLALAFAKANDIDPIKSSANAGDMVVTTDDATGKASGKFSDLPLGYYLVDSNVGALCGLTTTNPDASINAKNGTPTINKQVKEDSTNQWVDANTADIGQTVEFRVTISVHAGAENYVLHDVMSAGLTFDRVTKIERVIPGVTESETVTNTLTFGTDYTVAVDKDRVLATTPAEYTALADEDECTLEVTFAKAFCDTLDTNDKIVVTYQAMLNRNAIVSGEGNQNKAELEYGEHHFTTEDVTTTKTFGFDLVKTDSQNLLLDGAKFRIYDAAEGGNEVGVVLMDDGVTYRRARADETGVEIVVKDGQVRIVGFDNGTYFLEETAAPKGYNKLTARQRFIISDANLDATFNDGIFSTGSGVHVVNKTGSILPETGGLGTTLFIIVGGMVMLGCGVVLFTRKRMSQIAE